MYKTQINLTTHHSSEHQYYAEV